MEIGRIAILDKTDQDKSVRETGDTLITCRTKDKNKKKQVTL